MSEPKPQNPMSSAEPWNLVAEGYVTDTAPFLERFAKQALGYVKLFPEARVLDVACGPGTLSLLLADQVKSVEGVDFSESMLASFREAIRKRKLSQVTLHHRDAQELPFAEGDFDLAFSMFGLMFFPDRLRALREVCRVLKPGGKAVLSGWAPVEDSPLMQLLFGALRAADPTRPEPKKMLESWENPEFLKSELEQSGLEQVRVHRASESMKVETPELFWESMVRGAAPLALMKSKCSEADWALKQKTAVAYLREKLASKPLILSSDAWIAVGIKPVK